MMPRKKEDEGRGLVMLQAAPCVFLCAPLQGLSLIKEHTAVPCLVVLDQVWKPTILTSSQVRLIHGPLSRHSQRSPYARWDLAVERTPEVFMAGRDGWAEERQEAVGRGVGE